jgi:L-aspartate oxidase
MGGVKVNIWGETSIPGLFAAGETACTGVHGANRLASNSLLESVVFGKRIVQRTEMSSAPRRGKKKSSKTTSYCLPEREELSKVPSLNLPNLQSLMWDKVGIIRSGKSLREAADILATYQGLLARPSDRPAYEVTNLVLCARLVTEAALLREESRGAHFRTDFPRTSRQWLRHIIFGKDAVK